MRQQDREGDRFASVRSLLRVLRGVSTMDKNDKDHPNEGDSAEVQPSSAEEGTDERCVGEVTRHPQPAETAPQPLEELEEYVEPLDTSASSPPSLEVGDTVEVPGLEVTYRVQSVVAPPDWQPPYHLYVIVPEGIADDLPPEKGGAGFEELTPELPPSLWLWEASPPDAVAFLKREADVLSQLNLPMFPKVYAHFESGHCHYMVSEPLPNKSLAAATESGEVSLNDYLNILAQAAYALSYLHQKGWVHLGIRPSAILLGKPIKIVDMRWAVRIGEKPSSPSLLPGYCPPEIGESQEVDARADIYCVGALLHNFVTRKPILEAGTSDIGQISPFGGVPQILRRCLGTVDERFPDMSLLHQALLQMKRRYASFFRYSVAGASTIGLEPSRTTNQDAYGYLEGAIRTEMAHTRWLLACVADGMGGMESGDVASAVAVRTVLSEAALSLVSVVPDAETQVSLIKEWVHKANEKVCAAMEQSRSRGGTTLLGCLLVGNRLAIAHVGDCRLYQIRDGECRLLTRDHSLAMVLMMQEGSVDPDALRHHPERSKITRSLGERTPLPHYFVDTLEVVTGKATMDLRNGDVLLLCSDGLWEPVASGEIAEVVQRNKADMSSAVRQLLGLTLQRGAPDNATVLLVQVHEEPSSEMSWITGGDEQNAEHRNQAAPAVSESEQR